MKDALVDIRIPTFRRPVLLERALRSLLDQDHSNWQATILDDCPEGSAEAVATILNDSRISHRKNRSNYGATSNIDRAFSPKSFAPNAQWATVLEDDNAFKSGFLSKNLHAAQKSASNLLQRNSSFATIDPKGAITEYSHTALEHLYGKSPRWLSWDERLFAAFTRPAIANLGLFWKLDCEIDLTVDNNKIDSFTQEHLRGLLISENIWYEPEPLAWISHFEIKPSQTKDQTQRNRTVRRSRIAFMKLLLNLTSKTDLTTILNNARAEGRERDLRLAMAEAGHLPSFLRPYLLKHALFLLKGFFLILCYPNPLRNCPTPTRK